MFYSKIKPVIWVISVSYWSITFPTIDLQFYELLFHKFQSHISLC